MTMTPADYTGLYTDMCTWIWYRDHPDYPRDDLWHTSDVCRRDATQIFTLLGIVPSPAEQEEIRLHIEECGSGLVEYMERCREDKDDEAGVEVTPAQIAVAEEQDQARRVKSMETNPVPSLDWISGRLRGLAGTVRYGEIPDGLRDEMGMICDWIDELLDAERAPGAIITR